MNKNKILERVAERDEYYGKLIKFMEELNVESNEYNDYCIDQICGILAMCNDEEYYNLTHNLTEEELTPLTEKEVEESEVAYQKWLSSNNLNDDNLDF